MSDPKNTPITVQLEALNGKSIAITKGNNGFSVWYYDPRNRVMTPNTTIFPTLSELVAELVEFFIDTCPDDPAIKTTLEKSLQWAELIRLEFKAKAYETGGYLTADSTEKDAIGDPVSRILPDKTKAEICAGQAKKLRQKLQDLLKPKHDSKQYKI